MADGRQSCLYQPSFLYDQLLFWKEFALVGEKEVFVEGMEVPLAYRLNLYRILKLTL